MGPTGKKKKEKKKKKKREEDIIPFVIFNTLTLLYYMNVLRYKCIFMLGQVFPPKDE